MPMHIQNVCLEYNINSYMIIFEVQLNKMIIDQLSKIDFWVNIPFFSNK